MLALASMAVLTAAAGFATAGAGAADDPWPDARRGLLHGDGVIVAAPLDLVQGERAPLVLRDVPSDATLRLVSPEDETLHEAQLEVAANGLAWFDVPRDAPAGDARLVLADSALDVRVHAGPRLFSLDMAHPAVGTRASLEAAGFDPDAPLSVAIVQGGLRWTAAWDDTGAAVAADVPHVDDAAAVLGLGTTAGELEFLVAATAGASTYVWFNGSVAGAPASLAIAWQPEARAEPGVWFEPVHAQGLERFQAGSTAFVHGVGFDGQVSIEMENASTTLEAHESFFAGWVEVPMDAPAQMRVRIVSTGPSGEPMMGEQWVEVDPPTALLEATGPPLQADVYQVPASGVALVVSAAAGAAVAVSASRWAPRRGPSGRRTRSADE